MRDGIALARQGLPALAFVTEAFWPQGNFIASAEGMPDIPRVKLPHPVAGTGKAALAAVARQVREEVLERLAGR